MAAAPLCAGQEHCCQELVQHWLQLVQRWQQPLQHCQELVQHCQQLL
jgi:hypothetical protein